jgi:hypothetical protein
VAAIPLHLTPRRASHPRGRAAGRAADVTHVTRLSW